MVRSIQKRQMKREQLIQAIVNIEYFKHTGEMSEEDCTREQIEAIERYIAEVTPPGPPEKPPCSGS